MADMRDRLHSEIDEVEALSSAAAEIAEGKRPRLAQLVNQALREGDLEDLADVFEVVAQEYERELMSLTTRAFRTGVEFQRKRFAVR